MTLAVGSARLLAVECSFAGLKHVVTQSFWCQKNGSVMAQRSPSICLVSGGACVSGLKAINAKQMDITDEQSFLKEIV